MRIPIHKLTSSLLMKPASASEEVVSEGRNCDVLPPYLCSSFLFICFPSYPAREPDRHSSSSELHVAGLLHHALLGSSRGSPPPGAARAVAAHEGDGNKCRQRLHRVAAEASAPRVAGGSVHDDDRGDGARDGRRR